mmetsp:Transcript_42432/g.136762  ORF Transcript_42432/g.136762 Transcript_42432/m.136762 type:complete len:354 (-) Transcript_42432:182-1243(-)
MKFDTRSPYNTFTTRALGVLLALGLKRMRVVAGRARLAALPGGRAVCASVCDDALGAREGRDATRRRLEGVEAPVLEVGAEKVPHLVVAARALDGPFGLRLGRDFVGLEGALTPPQLAVSILLAVDRDVVAIKGLAHQTVRSHHLARLGVGRERVSQRRKREVDLLLAARGGALDEARGRINGPAAGAHVQDLSVVVLRHSDGEVFHHEGRPAGQHSPRAALEAVDDRRGRHVWRKLDADGPAGGLGDGLDEDVRDECAAHLEDQVREEEGARLEEDVDGQAGVVKHCVEVAVLAAEVGLATVRKVQVRVAGEAARLEGRRRWRGRRKRRWGWRTGRMRRLGRWHWRRWWCGW